MASARYRVVVTSVHGAHVGRATVARWQLRLLGAVGAAACIATLGVALHGLYLWRQACEAEQLRARLAVLVPLEERITASRGALRAQIADDAQALALLDSKSHLGPTGLAGLAVDAADSEARSADASPTSAAWAEPQASERLTAQVDSLLMRSTDLEATLADLLEYWRDAQQRLINTPSIRPARTAYATSSYGVRIDPLFHYWVMHKGLDLGGHVGMLVYAPADGVVIWTGVRGGYGQVVVIDHGLGLQTHYAHLSRYLVHRGQSVRRGEPIAEMGTTGKSTGPHLHYEVRQDGVPLDPRNFILD